MRRWAASGVADLLWATAETPRFDGGGGNLRQANLLVRLAEHHRITVADAGGDPIDPAVAAAVAEVVAVGGGREAPRTWSRFEQRWRDLRFVLGRGEGLEAQGQAAARARLDPVVRARRGGLVVLQHAGLAPLVEACAGPRTVLELHNDAVERSRQQAAVAPHWRHRLLWQADARRAARTLRRPLALADALVCTSDDDASRLPPGAWVVPNGVDLDRFGPTPVPAGPRICFTATLHYEPNVDGARWFVDAVLPRIRSAVPLAAFELVGRTPIPEVEALLAEPGVTGAFDVPDVRPHLAAARVAVVPVRVGTGTRLKALEAMAAGRPVVGTTVGLEGLGIEAGRHALVADDAESFAAAVVRLLDDDDLASSIATAARAFVEDVYGWGPIAEAYSAKLDVLAGGRS